MGVRGITERAKKNNTEHLCRTFPYSELSELGGKEALNSPVEWLTVSFLFSKLTQNSAKQFAGGLKVSKN